MARILIIDDEPALRAVLTAALEQAGHSVLQAGDGKGGMHIMQSEKVDLVLTDVMMPDKDGIEVIMHLREAGHAPPIIAMTGHPEAGELYLKVARSLGARAVLEKPFRIQLLLSTVNDVLGLR